MISLEPIFTRLMEYAETPQGKHVLEVALQSAWKVTEPVRKKILDSAMNEMGKLSDAAKKKFYEVATEYTNKKIEHWVKETVIEQLGVKEEQVTNDASFVEDLGADSLDTVELTMAAEKEFELEIPDEDAEKITTVQQAIDYIKCYLSHSTTMH